MTGRPAANRPTCSVSGETPLPPLVRCFLELGACTMVRGNATRGRSPGPPEVAPPPANQSRSRPCVQASNPCAGLRKVLAPWEYAVPGPSAGRRLTPPSGRLVPPTFKAPNALRSSCLPACGPHVTDERSNPARRLRSGHDEHFGIAFGRPAPWPFRDHHQPGIVDHHHRNTQATCIEGHRPPTRCLTSDRHRGALCAPRRETR